MKESEKKRKLFLQQQKDWTSVVRKYNKVPMYEPEDPCVDMLTNAEK
jgi:hypothetical protein